MELEEKPRQNPINGHHQIYFNRFSHRHYCPVIRDDNERLYSAKCFWDAESIIIGIPNFDGSQYFIIDILDSQLEKKGGHFPCVFAMFHHSYEKMD